MAGAGGGEEELCCALKVIALKPFHAWHKPEIKKMGLLCLFLPCLPIVLSVFFSLIYARNVRNLDISQKFLLPVYKQKLLINDTLT